MEIRPFSECEVSREQLFELYKRSLIDLIEAVFGWKEEEQRQRFERAYPNGELFVLFVAEEVAGCLALRNSPKRKHVALLLLESEFQGLGFGRSIMENIHAEARLNKQEVTLCSFKRNVRAIQFYERLGYRIVGEEEAFVDMRLEK